MFPEPLSSPSNITITPVTNGWLLHFPQVKNFNDQFKSIGPMMKDIVKEIRDSGDDDVEALIKSAQRDLEKQEKPAPPRYTRDTDYFIFNTFPEVLAFLAREIEEED